MSKKVKFAVAIKNQQVIDVVIEGSSDFVARVIKLATAEGVYFATVTGVIPQSSGVFKLEDMFTIKELDIDLEVAFTTKKDEEIAKDYGRDIDDVDWVLECWMSDFMKDDVRLEYDDFIVDKNALYLIRDCAVELGEWREEYDSDIDCVIITKTIVQVEDFRTIRNGKICKY